MAENSTKNSRLRQAVQELKFIRSPKDLKIQFDKLAYLLARSQTFPAWLGRRPLNLQIEPTNYCNVDCLCCSAPLSTRPRGFMPFDLFAKIIDEAQKIGVARILLYLHGEPLLHPQIEAMMRYIKSQGLAFTLYSNGMSLNGERAERIFQTGVDCADYFTFSFLGHSKAMHEGLMQRVNHERVVANILNFLETRARLKKNGPIVEVIYQQTPENRLELHEFVQYWRRYADHVLVGDTIAYAFSREKENASRIPLRERTCRVLWDRLTIFWNGDVTLCCIDTNGEHLLGNLEKQSLAQVWASDELRRIKNLHRQNAFARIPICAYCDM